MWTSKVRGNLFMLPLVLFEILNDSEPKLEYDKLHAKQTWDHRKQNKRWDVQKVRNWERLHYRITAYKYICPYFTTTTSTTTSTMT